MGLWALLCLACWACAPPAPPNEAATPEEPPPAEVIPLDVSLIWGYVGDRNPNDVWESHLYQLLREDIRWGLALRVPDFDGMVLVPAGRVALCPRDTASGKRTPPRRGAAVRAFYLDRTEVTRGAYNQCVAARLCLPLPDPPSANQGEDADDRPAGLSYKQAERYCLWAGKRLPTEVEWERAALGDGRLKYPWGDDEPDPTRANICGAECTMSWADPTWRDEHPYAAPVDAYAAGDSPFGLRQMVGNHKERVAAPEVVPGHFVARGASWYSTLDQLPGCYRGDWSPPQRVDDKGVRCAADAK
jgi:formylglycine-generating enzyme required for sulfatase activity